MIDFPIVDTHLHLWDPGRLSYPWLEEIPLLNKPHLLKDFAQACGSVEVERMVFLQCEPDSSQFMAEADWISQLAQQDRRIEGIVSGAPLEKGDAVRHDLEALAQNRLIKGIRRIIQFEADPEFCLQPDFIAGVRMLTQFNLSFDICIGHHQLANTIKFVRQCPQVRFILDHIGKPDIKNHVFEPWKQELKELAAIPNVWCKMSGLVTEADHEHWAADDLEPYINHVIECFGFDRVMYGGDWPVASQATEYPRWVQTLASVLASASTDQMRKLFHDNAISFYRL